MAPGSAMGGGRLPHPRRSAAAAAGLSAPEELLARALPPGGVRLTWFFDELLLEQLAAGCAECPCRPPPPGGAVREQVCLLDGCTPGRVYEFSVRARANVRGGGQRRAVCTAADSNHVTIRVPSTPLDSPIDSPRSDAGHPRAAARAERHPRRRGPAREEPDAARWALEAAVAAEGAAIAAPAAEASQPLRAHGAGGRSQGPARATPAAGPEGHAARQKKPAEERHRPEPRWQLHADSPSLEQGRGDPPAQPDSEPSPVPSLQWQCRGAGPPKVLRWAEEPAPAPSRGQAEAAPPCC
ncbi:unnamed protein product, partial [Prorocentrum cordatum]